MQHHKMKRGKIIYSFLILGIFLIGIASSANYCCEKTNSGAWCQEESSKSECNPSYNAISAGCESTSYCKTGTCINQKEGTCIASTESVCTNNGGIWSDKSESDLSQCSLGCCLLGDQVAFVTQIACNRMASTYGLTINWNANINDELTCLASANPNAKGACVYTDAKTSAKTCEMTTKENCQNNAKTLSDVSFHEGFLCSAPELGTICAKSANTICSGDDVYFTDTCGNLANIYDASKKDSVPYWTTIQKPDCTAASNPGNKNSATCGDCDYYSGSMCQTKKAGESVSVGNNLCRSLDCSSYNGIYSGTGKPKHGETWCATDAKAGNENSPGSTSFRMMCYNGEVTMEECDSTRQKVCSESDIGTTDSPFMSANCRANVWQDCILQTKEEDCNDVNVRDCSWIASSGYSYSVEEGKLVNSSSAGLCVPKIQPGFARDGTTDAIDSCQLANTLCYVQMKKDIINSNYVCEGPDLNNLWWNGNNCSCVNDANGNYDGGKTWASKMNSICTKLGDCGDKTNYAGAKGNVQESITKTNLSTGTA
ncbi:Uncharacterised protein [uncultured archaeon]|nr:Uncharacterised protein [uncultured archaeon]